MSDEHAGFVQIGRWMWCAYCGAIVAGEHYCGAPWQQRDPEIPDSWVPGAWKPEIGGGPSPDPRCTVSGNLGRCVLPANHDGSHQFYSTMPLTSESGPAASAIPPPLANAYVVDLWDWSHGQGVRGVRIRQLLARHDALEAENARLRRELGESDA